MLEYGNIREKVASHPETRGWFVGNFIDQESLLYSEKFEMKCHIYKKGETHIWSTAHHPRKTLAILISGKVRFSFSEKWTSHMLDIPFDYIADNEIPWAHTVEALEDSIILTIRDINP